jgi:hypothetical protein
MQLYLILIFGAYTLAVYDSLSPMGRQLCVEHI